MSVDSYKNNTGIIGRFKSYFSNLFTGNNTINSKTATPLRYMIKELVASSNNMNAKEQYLLSNFLKFYNKTVDDVMTPRSDIKAVNSQISFEELKLMLTKNLYTRTLVYENNLDHVLGFIHIKDLFKIIVKQENFNLAKILRNHIIATPSMKLIDLLAVMQKERTHMSVVVDEYGGTDGIVTVEDIVEEILGPLEDEHMSSEVSQKFTYQIIDSNIIIVSARLEIEILEKIIGINLKFAEDEYDTIGGLVLSRIGYMPPIGFIIELSDDIKAEIIDATPRILKKIKLTISAQHQFSHIEI